MEPLITLDFQTINTKTQQKFWQHGVFWCVFFTDESFEHGEHVLLFFGRDMFALYENHYLKVTIMLLLGTLGIVLRLSYQKIHYLGVDASHEKSLLNFNRLTLNKS